MRKTLLTVGIATACLLAPAAAAEATTAQHLTCPKPSVRFTQTGLASFTASTSQPGCTVQLSSWAVPDSYDDKGHDASAKPQTLVDRTVATLTGDLQTVAVKVPASRWCQIDFRAAGGAYLYGRIVECHPVPPSTVTPKPPVIGHPKPVHHAKPKAPAKKPVARVRLTASVTPAAVPQLAMTGVSEGLVLTGLAGGALVFIGAGLIWLPRGFSRNVTGPKHKELSK